MSKKTEPLRGKSLVALILDTYQEYVNSGYPKDPNIYVIRAHPDSVSILKVMNNNVIFNSKSVDLSGDRFMGFRLIAKSYIPRDVIDFGPETVEIEWSK